MSELLTNFGVNWKLLIAQVINFGVLFYALKRFAYRPILDVMKRRENIVRKGIEDASTAEKKLMKAGEDAAEIKTSAKKEAHALLIEAHGEAKDIIEEAKQEAIEEKRDIMASTKKEIDDAKKAGEEILAKKAADHIISGISAMLGKEMTPELNTRLIRNLAKRS
jgi:F-type H+-transporting ATPase subunit b